MLAGNQEQGIAYVMDLSERKKAEQQLKLAATVFAASSDGILITDSSARIVSVNQALCAMTGYSEGELLGQPPSILQSGYTTDEEYNRMWEALNKSGQWQGDVIDRKKDGALIPMRVSINQVKNADNQLTHYVAILSDITERKAAEEHLRHIALHDPLTGLANRVLFNDRLEQAIKLATRNNTKFAVLFLDLDKFKPVNDLFGHKIGDKLIAKELQTGSLEASANPIPSPAWAATNSSYCSKILPARKWLKNCLTLLSIQYATLTILMITISKLA